MESRDFWNVFTEAGNPERYELIKAASPERQAAAFAVLTGGIDALYTEPTYKDPRDKELWAAKDKGNFAEWKAWVKPEFIEKGGKDEG